MSDAPLGSVNKKGNILVRDRCDCIFFLKI